MTVALTFLGAAGTVTGSKYLLTAGSSRVLVDCGLFQGLKRLRERNWSRLAFDPRELDAVILTHAHLDHTGFLPVLARSGYRGPVYCTAATQALLGILLPDSARLQAEEAGYANRHRYSKHSPALPLYTEEDAAAVLQLVRPIEWFKTAQIAPGMTASVSPAGHVLGAGSVLIDAGGARILFSGDVGRPDDPLMRPPAAPPAADWSVIESTYGDRRHQAIDAEAELEAVLGPVLARGGVVVVPAFAVGRAQLLLHLLVRLKARRAIADVPVLLNSPMATNVRALFHQYRGDHRLTPAECDAMCDAARIVNTVEESKALNQRSGPMIILAGSGMATGGRVVHHLKAFAPDPNNLILLTGFQAAGTRGAALAAGTDSIKIHGQWVPVRAEVAQLKSTSSHADASQLVSWLKSGPEPKRIFVTHGEPSAADALRQQLRRDTGAEVTVPEHGETYEFESRATSASGTVDTAAGNAHVEP